MGKRLKKIDRRTVLRGMGGVAVALPALELMGHPDEWGPRRAHAQEAPKRFLVAYAGTSTSHDGQEGDFITPSRVGRGYELLEATEPLREIQDEVSLVTGLRVPYGEGLPGERSRKFHAQNIACTFAGTTTTRSLFPLGPTVAEVAADALTGSRSHRILNYLVEQGVGSALGFEWLGTRSRVVSAISNPRLAYDNLFTGFTPPSTGTGTGTGTPPPQMPPASTGASDLALRGRRSVLDLVSTSTERLLREVGTVDQQRLELHFDQIRDLETRLSNMGGNGGGTGGGGDTGGGGSTTPPMPTGQGCAAFDVSAATQREIGEAFGRLAVMSWACDLASVTSLSMTSRKCEMALSEISDLGLPGDVHSGTHDSGSRAENLAVSLAWFVEQFAFITRLARDTPAADGSSLLDNAALTLFFEGGGGYSPEEGNRTNRSHSMENMAMLVAGRAGGLRPGQHILGRDRHTAQVMVSLLNAVGIDTPRLNEVEGNIPELFQPA